MNKLTIIGNLTGDPELRTTPQGLSVCNFNVAVNKRRKSGEEPQAEFFRVTAWREKAELCAKYLVKGKKVCVFGEVSAKAYISQRTNEARASLEVTAEDVEFLTPASQTEAYQAQAPALQKDEQSGMDIVPQEDLPF